MNSKHAINFFLFSYFGITLCSDRESVIDAAIKRAYRDATNQGAFNTLIGKQSDDLKKQAESTKEKASNIIKKFIDDKKMNYDTKHQHCCENIFEKYKENRLDKFLHMAMLKNGLI